jgi:hypothetical protein
MMEAVRTSETSVDNHFVCFSFLTTDSERRDREVNSPASYSGGPGFNLSPETGYNDLGIT